MTNWLAGTNRPYGTHINVNHSAESATPNELFRPTFAQMYGKYHCTVHRLLFLLALHEWKCSGLNLEANSRETCGEKGTPPAIAQHNAAKTALQRLLAQSLGLGRVVVEKVQKHFWRIRLRFQGRLLILFPRGLKM